MPKSFLWIIAVLVLPCLVVNPVLGAGGIPRGFGIPMRSTSAGSLENFGCQALLLRGIAQRRPIGPFPSMRAAFSSVARRASGPRLILVAPLAGAALAWLTLGHAHLQEYWAMAPLFFAPLSDPVAPPNFEESLALAREAVQANPLSERRVMRAMNYLYTALGEMAQSRDLANGDFAGAVREALAIRWPAAVDAEARDFDQELRKMIAVRAEGGWTRALKRAELALSARQRAVTTTEADRGMPEEPVADLQRSLGAAGQEELANAIALKAKAQTPRWVEGVSLPDLISKLPTRFWSRRSGEIISFRDVSFISQKKNSEFDALNLGVYPRHQIKLQVDPYNVTITETFTDGRWFVWVIERAGIRKAAWTHFDPASGGAPCLTIVFDREPAVTLRSGFNGGQPLPTRFEAWEGDTFGKHHYRMTTEMASGADKSDSHVLPALLPIPLLAAYLAVHGAPLASPLIFNHAASMLSALLGSAVFLCGWFRSAFKSAASRRDARVLSRSA